MKWDLKSILTLVIVIPWMLVTIYLSVISGQMDTALSQVATTVIFFFFGTKVGKAMTKDGDAQ